MNIFGAAPDSDIIVVKLREAKLPSSFSKLIPPEAENVYKSTDVILGIEYIIEKAIELNRPVAICIGIGTNEGGHDGFLVLEEYITGVRRYRRSMYCSRCTEMRQVQDIILMESLLEMVIQIILK